MSLRTFEEARPWAKSIKLRVAARQMPPWHIDRGVGVQKFKNDMSLTDEQIDTIVAWVDQGAPQGRPADFRPPSRRDGLIGRPSATATAARISSSSADVHDARVASGRMVAAVVDIPLTEPRWVEMVEIRRRISKGARSSTTRSRITFSIRQRQAVNTASAAAPVAGAATISSTARPQLMEWAIGKGYDRYIDGTGQADHAGREDLVGSAHPRVGRK
jgi:hypothetical protein